MATGTPAQILTILDDWTRVFRTMNNLASYNGNVNSQTDLLATSDINLISLVGTANEIATAQPYQVGNNSRPIGQQFAQLGSWMQQFSGVAVGNADAYLTSYNAVTPYSYLASPVTAQQYKIAAGGSPLPSTSAPLVASTNNYMTPANVFAPITTFGAGTITGANVATYANNVNLPTSNNSIQIIRVTNASSGTWTFSYNNVTVSGLAYNISASALQTAINAIAPFLSTPGVVVTSPATGTWIVQGVDAFSRATGTMLTAAVTNSALVGVGAAVTIQNTSASTWQLVITASGGNYTLAIGNTADGVYTTANIAFGATAGQIQSALTALLPIGTGNVVVTGSAGTYQITAAGILNNQRFDYNFLTVNQGTLSGGSATLKQTVLGGVQGYTPPAVTNAVVTTTVNGTCVLTVTANVWDSAGVYHAGRTFTATLSSATAGTVVALTPGTAGDRIARVTGIAVAGTATAGVFNLTSVLDRTIA